MLALTARIFVCSAIRATVISAFSTWPALPFRLPMALSSCWVRLSMVSAAAWARAAWSRACAAISSDRRASLGPRVPSCTAAMAPRSSWVVEEEASEGALFALYHADRRTFLHICVVRQTAVPLRAVDSAHDDDWRPLRPRRQA